MDVDELARLQVSFIKIEAADLLSDDAEKRAELMALKRRLDKACGFTPIASYQS